MTTTREHPAGSELHRWNPWPELFAVVPPRLGQLLDPMWHHDEGYAPGDMVEETDDAFTIELDLPGVAKDDITLDVTGRRVSIHGQRTEKEATGILRHATRVTGTFSYELGLPAPVDEAAVTAALTDGVLTVRLPKADSAKTTRIPIG